MQILKLRTAKVQADKDKEVALIAAEQDKEKAAIEAEQAKITAEGKAEATRIKADAEAEANKRSLSHLLQNLLRNRRLISGMVMCRRYKVEMLQQLLTQEN